MPAREACTTLRLAKSYRKVAFKALESRELRVLPPTLSTISKIKSAYDAFASLVKLCNPVDARYIQPVESISCIAKGKNFVTTGNWVAWNPCCMHTTP